MEDQSSAEIEDNKEEFQHEEPIDEVGLMPAKGEIKKRSIHMQCSLSGRKS